MKVKFLRNTADDEGNFCGPDYKTDVAEIEDNRSKYLISMHRAVEVKETAAAKKSTAKKKEGDK